MMWQRFQEAVEAQGGQVWLGTEVVRLERNEGHVTGVVAKRNGEEYRITGDHFLSSMPLRELLGRFDPLPPDEVVRAAHRERRFPRCCLPLDGYLKKWYH